MGLFNRKEKKSVSKKVRNEKELSEEELDNVTAGNPSKRDWCPKVNVEPLDEDELTEEELDDVKAGIHEFEDR